MGDIEGLVKMRRILTLRQKIDQDRIETNEDRGFFLIVIDRDGEPRCVEPLDPPAGSQPGDRVFVQGYESAGPPDDKLNPKKKIWEKLQVDLAVDEQGRAQWQGHALVTDAGPVTAQTITKAPIK